MKKLIGAYVGIVLGFAMGALLLERTSWGLQKEGGILLLAAVGMWGKMSHRPNFVRRVVPGKPLPPKDPA